ncbi:MAG: hypothetical protein JXR48_04970 [Candidatus Delongbacteria bacterium]|nr:hypothetical protein [Candidatus Delongbacteria bacterium]MBN2834300.1 hypothetical protein [Candidatus Delongbacteria bacterium]
MKKIIFILVALFTISLFADKIYLEALGQNAAQELLAKGYKHVTGFNTGKLAKGDADYQVLNLYKGVEYSIVFGADDSKSSLTIEVYNQNFDMIKTKTITGDTYSSIDLSGLETGPYYVKIKAIETPVGGSGWFFQYSYK